MNNGIFPIRLDEEHFGSIDTRASTIQGYRCPKDWIRRSQDLGDPMHGWPLNSIIGRIQRHKQPRTVAHRIRASDV